MRIAFKAHVLCKVLRFHQFTDVVEISADAAERRVRADRFRGSFGEIGHHEAMMISARRFDGHASQQRMV